MPKRPVPGSRCVSWAMGALIVVVLGSSACGDEAPTDYAEQNRKDFLAACADPLTDDLLDIELCQCVFDAIQAEIDFARFTEIEQTLVDNPRTKLPADVVELVADCVIELGEL